MARKDHAGETPATSFLRQHGIAFEPHLYEYEEHGGTRVSARALGVDEHCVVKTLVMEDERRQPLVVLMHGDRTVSTKQLAREAKLKTVQPCQPDVAQRHTGYMVGGTSPFSTRKTMPVYMEASIVELPRIYINGGRRGSLVSMDPKDVVRLLQPALVNVALSS